MLVFRTGCWKVSHSSLRYSNRPCLAWFYWDAGHITHPCKAVGTEDRFVFICGHKIFALDRYGNKGCQNNFINMQVSQTTQKEVSACILFFSDYIATAIAQSNILVIKHRITIQSLGITI